MESLGVLGQAASSTGGGVALAFIVALALGIGTMMAVYLGSAVIVLDRFRRHHDHQGHLARRLGHSAYGAFVAQGPVLVLIALALRPANLSGDIKFLLLAPTAVIVSFSLAGVALTLSANKRRSTTT